MSLLGKLNILGVITPLSLQYCITRIDADRIKQLRVSPVIVVPKPKNDEFVEVVSGAFVMYVGKEILTQTGDNMRIKYGDSIGAIGGQAIRTAGFIDASKDVAIILLPEHGMIISFDLCVGMPLVLCNDGNSEFGGNASNDALLVTQIAYRLHRAVL